LVYSTDRYTLPTFDTLITCLAKIENIFRFAHLSLIPIILLSLFGLKQDIISIELKISSLV